MLKRWTLIFKALSNINRLKIISILNTGRSLTVSELAREIDISLKSTSKHLIILKNLEILESVGRKGHVYYSLNTKPAADVRTALKSFLSR